MFLVIQTVSHPEWENNKCLRNEGITWKKIPNSFSFSTLGTTLGFNIWELFLLGHGDPIILFKDWVNAC